MVIFGLNLLLISNSGVRKSCWTTVLGAKLSCENVIMKASSAVLLSSDFLPY